MKNSRFANRIKEKLQTLSGKKKIYNEFWLDDTLGIGGTSYEDVLRVDESKRKRKVTKHEPINKYQPW